MNMYRNLLALICFLAAISMKSQQTEIPNKYQVGEYNVYILTENAGKGNTSILINAPDEVIRKYIPDGTFPNATRAVLVEKKGEVWLMDTGFGRNIFGQMTTLGLSPEKVNHVLLTHMHGDHIGGMLRDDKPMFANADVTLSEKESWYWTSEEEKMKIPEGRRGSFLSAQNVLRKYGNKVNLQKPHSIEEELPDGMHMLEAYGHTPGHVMFLIKEGEKELLIWGDLTHALAVQMPHPEISVTYDVDPDLARESRIKVLKYVTKNQIPVAGMHVPFSGIGSVKKEKEAEGYVFSPF